MLRLEREWETEFSAPNDRAYVQDALIELVIPSIGSSKKIPAVEDNWMIGMAFEPIFEPKRRFRLTAMLMFLLLALSSAYAQSGTDGAPTSPPQSSTPSSALNGNWHVAGNRIKKQFPLLSIYLHVDGTQIIGHGWLQAVCPNDPRNGAGGNLSLNGEIAPDGVFTLRNNPRSTLHVEISGQAPAEGEITWSGEYTLTGDISHECPSYRQTNSFTATPLAPLNGTFSGSLKTHYFQSAPATYTESSQANFNITMAQGAAASQKLNTGGVHFYLPITGTIQVKGSSCFSKGQADPLTYSTHRSGPSRYSTLGGDALDLWFAMDDESQVNVIAVFADPGASALSIINARVIGGKCDHQSFLGTLERK
jgi:hypothetical protein